jgi:hypothetical protein
MCHPQEAPCIASVEVLQGLDNVLVCEPDCLRILMGDVLEEVR